MMRTSAQEEQNALVKCHSVPFESTDGEAQTRAAVTSSMFIHMYVVTVMCIYKSVHSFFCEVVAL